MAVQDLWDSVFLARRWGHALCPRRSTNGADFNGFFRAPEVVGPGQAKSLLSRRLYRGRIQRMASTACPLRRAVW